MYEHIHVRFSVRARARWLKWLTAKRDQFTSRGLTQEGERAGASGRHFRMGAVINHLARVCAGALLLTF